MSILCAATKMVQCAISGAMPPSTLLRCLNQEQKWRRNAAQFQRSGLRRTKRRIVVNARQYVALYVCTTTRVCTAKRAAKGGALNSSWR
jgi:hypothetical protein